MNETNCKYCHSTNTKKFGTFNGIQRYYCNDCKRKFVANTALPYMQTPVEQVALALSLYYDGLSLNAIRRNLKQAYGNYPSDSTVYSWITRFTKEAIDRTKHYKPHTGYVWIADETVLNIEGKKIWLWDLIDIKTRFLLASHLSEKRTVEDVQTLMRRAYVRAGKLPKVIMTDRLSSYDEGIKMAYGDNVKHLQVKKFTARPNDNVIERMQGIIKDRSKVMRGLKKMDTARLITDGFLVHYNFFRPHETLATKQNKFRTPAEKAEIKLPYENWLGLIKNKGESVTVAEPVTIQPIKTLMTPKQLTRKHWREASRIKKAKKRAKRQTMTTKVMPQLRSMR